MVSFFLNSANSILSTLGEVVAPTVDTPLEAFKDHWKAIRNFYIDEDYDIETFQEAGIPEHLVSMISILLEEERTEATEGDIEYQPCLEFFMSNKIMEILCILGEKDNPPGVRKLVLTAINQLLSEMHQSILPNVSIHNPIKNLIEKCSLETEVEKTEFTTLLVHIVNELLRQPLLVPSFFIEHQVNNAKESIVDFPIFTGLLNHRNDDGVAGESAKKAMTLLLQLPDREIIDYIQNCTNLSSIVIADLNNLYRALPTTTAAISKMVTSKASSNTHNSTSILSSFAFLAFQSQAQFIITLVNTIDKEMSDSIIQKMEEEFLNAVFAPSLLQPDDKAAATATIYLREIIILFTKSDGMMHMLNNFLLGDFNDAETEEDESEHMIRSTLLRRLESDHEELCVNTLKLFEGLVRSSNKHVMYNLLLRNLIPRNHLYMPDVNQHNLHTSIAKFLTLFSDTDFSSSFSSGYEAYLLDAQEQIQQCTISCQQWGHDSQLFFIPSITPSNSSGSTTSTTYPPITSPVDSASFTNYLEQDDDDDIQKFLASESPKPISTSNSYHASHLNTEENEEKVEQFFGGGLFLRIMFEKLERVPQSPLDTNLIVTGIFTTLAHYPFPVLYSFLLNNLLPVRPGIKTLWSVLMSLHAQIEEKKAQIPRQDYTEALAEARRTLMSEEEVQGQMTKEKEEMTRFLQGVIVLEEFCKELAATAGAQNSNDAVVPYNTNS